MSVRCWLTLQWKAEWKHQSKWIVQSSFCVCVVHVFPVVGSKSAQIQQWFHSGTAKMPFLQTATAIKIENYSGEILILNLKPNKFTTKYFRANLSELRYPFWVDYYFAYLTTTKSYDPAHVSIWKYIWSRLLQNAKAHGPDGAVKTIEKPILQRTQAH